MINLLPHKIKQDITYARRNSRLRLWIIVGVLALAVAIIIIAGGLLYMQQTINSNNKQLEIARQHLQDQNVEETQKRVAEISNNTKLTTQVLSREILFSKLIKQIGSSLPAGTALTSLEIDEIQGGIQLDAGAADFNAATQIQVNLQDPQKNLFKKADINSISCKDEPGANAPTDSLYPCSVSLRALFAENNAFVYMTPPQGAKKQ